LCSYDFGITKSTTSSTMSLKQSALCLSRLAIIPHLNPLPF
jgi:hypothetical protein